MDKSAISMIELTRAEGPIKECGKEMAFGSETDPGIVWVRANHTLAKWGHTAPEDGHGYDKCDVIVYWENGETFKTRFDLVRGGTTHGGMTLKQSVSQVIRLYAGQWCPEHLKPHYKHLLARNPDFTTAMRRIYETCLI